MVNISLNIKSITIILIALFCFSICKGQTDSVLTTIYHSDGSKKREVGMFNVNSNEKLLSYELREYYSYTEDGDTTYKGCNSIDFNNWERCIKSITNYSYGEKENDGLGFWKHGSEYGFWMQADIINCYKIKNNDYCLKYYGYWIKGLKDGKWEYYDKSGKLIKTELYKKGKLIKTKEF